MADYSGTIIGSVGSDAGVGDGGDGGTALTVTGSPNSLVMGALRGGGIGGNGGSGGGNGGDGGLGVDLTTGAELTNNAGVYGGISGGTGGVSTSAGGTGGTGGIGVNLADGSTLTNNSRIYGGTGGDGLALGAIAGAGGVGVQLNAGATLNNTGVSGTVIRGGTGGVDRIAGGAAGTGVTVAGGSTLTNSAFVTGGGGGELTGYIGSSGGIGAELAAGGTLNNTGTIGGGRGGASDQGMVYTGQDGGIGLNMLTGSLAFNYGEIVGGEGHYNIFADENPLNSAGDGGVGARLDTALLNNIGVIRGGGGGAADHNTTGGGGIGAELTGASLLINFGQIEGGAAGFVTPGFGNSTAGGDGGDGVHVGNGSTLINFYGAGPGIIAGGAGGYGSDGGNGGEGLVIASGGVATNGAQISGGNGGGGIYVGGNGGAGVELANGGGLTNEGLISGGDGGGTSGMAGGGDGGVGVNLADGGTLTNNGTISGGAGGPGAAVNGLAGDAVHFGNGDSLLILGVNAIFNGAVTALDLQYNVIELTAGLGVGALSFPQFIGFDHIDLNSGAAWDIDGAVNTGVTLDFDGTNGTLGIDDADDFGAEIYGFDLTDLIDLENVSFASITGSSFSSVSGNLTVMTSGGDLTLDFGDPASFTGLTFSLSADGNVGTNITLACYCPGTLILTDCGEVPVEQLAIGDRLVTVWGAVEPIKWIGRRSYAGRFLAGNQHIQPVRIKAGALEEGLPKRDLVISPLHAMYIDGVLIPAGELVNGVSIVQEQVRQVEYIHIELEDHDLIWAEGAASETFVDDESRLMFQNAHEYAALYPDAVATPARYCAPRLTEGYALEAVRQRIALRAGPIRSACVQSVAA